MPIIQQVFVKKLLCSLPDAAGDTVTCHVLSKAGMSPSVVGWAVVERLAVGNLIDLIDPRSVRLRVLARMQEFGTRVSGAREVENERDKRKL